MLGFGALGEFPLADFGTPPPPKSVSLPAVSLAADFSAVAFRGGRNVALGAVNLTFASPALAVSAGRLLGLPRADIVLTPQRVTVLAGRSLAMPKISLTFAFGPLRLQSGRIFNLANTIAKASDAGALGEGALGEFALAEGKSLTQTYSLPVQLRFAAAAAGIQAGRNVSLTAPDVTFTTPVPEIDARRRKLRVLAIAS
jgi:hypothetical protein